MKRPKSRLQFTSKHLNLQIFKQSFELKPKRDSDDKTVCCRCASYQTFFVLCVTTILNTISLLFKIELEGRVLHQQLRRPEMQQRAINFFC